LTGGLALSVSATNPEKPLQIKIPVQFILPHKGGQLDTNTSTVSTVINHAVGLEIQWNNPNAKKWLKQVQVDSYRAGYFHSGRSNLYPYVKGHGWLANFFIKSKWDLFLLLTFWNGHQFIAPKGGKLFQSISSITTLPNYTEPDRKLFFLNLGYEKELSPGFFLDIRYSPYWDLHNHLAENAYLILFSYRGGFRLGTLKK